MKRVVFFNHCWAILHYFSRSKLYAKFLGPTHPIHVSFFIIDTHVMRHVGLRKNANFFSTFYSRLLTSLKLLAYCLKSEQILFNTIDYYCLQNQNILIWKLLHKKYFAIYAKSFFYLRNIKNALSPFITQPWTVLRLSI